MLLMIALVNSTITQASEQFVKSDKVLVVEHIQSRMIVCRQLIAELSDHRPSVIKQYDHLVETLLQCYRSGEGMIDRDVDQIFESIIFAAEKHRFQKRKDLAQTPYIIHPMGVAYLLMIIGKVRDPDVIIGALLHDTVEDTHTTFEEIEQKFGLRVASFVQEVTDDKTLSTLERKQSQVEHAFGKSAGAAQIKLADKLYNLTDLFKAPPEDWSKERVDAYFRWAEAVVNNLPWVNGPLKSAVDGLIREYWRAKEI